MTDSGDGGEGGGDELPCATKGEGSKTIKSKTQDTYILKLSTQAYMSIHVSFWLSGYCKLFRKAYATKNAGWC